MTSTNIINRLRDNAELSWAQYGYFELPDKEFEIKAAKKVGREKNQTITLTDIINQLQRI